MSKRFLRGLVVGKFSPLHRGHELLIEHALDECEEVVVISYSKPEFDGCEASRRKVWLTRLFPKARVLVATDENMGDFFATTTQFKSVPDNNEDAGVHRRFCGYLCAEVLRITVDVVFTSEDYGDDFARDLTAYFQTRNKDARTIQHMEVDRARTLAPISGTIIRENIHSNRHWLSPEVYSSFVKRICILGGESSGKSTLSEVLAQTLETAFVHEYGRELWEAKDGKLGFADMLLIAQTQIEMEEQSARRANQFLFCDTSPLTTLFYSRHLFGQADKELEKLAKRHYDLVVLCAPDFPFVQDGTRQPEAFRKLQHEWYLLELKKQKIPFLIAEGSLADRVKAVVNALTGKDRMRTVP